MIQLAKAETVLWYYLLWCAISGVRHMWGEKRRMLLILLLFAVPCTIIYTTTMSNIGLIFRQRIPIVMAVSLLSAVAWSRNSQGRQELTSGSRSDPAPAPAVRKGSGQGTTG